MRPETLAIHAGMKTDPTTGSVTPPVYRSTIYRHDAKDIDYSYIRQNNPNQSMLEVQLAALEGGEDAAVFSSGVAATHAVMQILNPGDHVLIPKDVYHGTRKLMFDWMGHWGLEVDDVDMRDMAEVEQALRPETRMIWIETPSNPMLHITDIGAVVELAHDRDIVVCVDNTWPTPVNQRPLELGADLVVHSTTKYLSGHSDLLGGAVITKTSDQRFKRLRDWQVSGGAVLSPDECWLLTRSIKSLPYRMRGHNENALKVVDFLEGNSKVEKVWFPGLESHAGHEVASRQMAKYGAMISFQVKAGAESIKQGVLSSRLIAPATSLGGVESTWEHRLSSEGPESATPDNLIRLSVGLEHPDDLTADIDRALRKMV